MAVCLMASMAVSAFAVDANAELVKFDFSGKKFAMTELPFYVYDKQNDKATIVNKSVEVVHINSKDKFTVTNTTTDYRMMLTGTIMTNSDGLGYTDVIASGAFAFLEPGGSTAITAIDENRLFDPAFSDIEYSKDAPLVIRMNMDFTATDHDGPITYKYVFVVLDDTATDVSHINKFNDVNMSDYFYEPVVWAVAKGITVGTTENTFSPHDTCTNAQIITFMWRSVGSPVSDADNLKVDIDPNSYYYNAVIWARTKGIIDENFNLNDPCTRAMTVDYFWKMNDKPKADTGSKFTDVSADASYGNAVSWALENGITSGTSDTTFSPNNTCTRAQIVTFLYRMNNF